MEELGFVSAGFAGLLWPYQIELGSGVLDSEFGHAPSYDDDLTGFQNKLRPKRRPAAERFAQKLDACKLLGGKARTDCYASAAASDTYGFFEYVVSLEGASPEKWRNYITPHFQ